MIQSNFKQIKEMYNNNYYTSVNSFKYRRTKSNLQELLSFYVDLDVYETDIIFLNDYQTNKHAFIISEIEKTCVQNNIPNPSRLIYSGNGYQLYWDIDAKNKPNENSYFKEFFGASYKLADVYVKVQKSLVTIFNELGGDYRATDVSRLLRTPGTINQKTSEEAIVLFSVNTKVDFSDFADKILYYSYEEYIEWAKPTKKQINNLTKHGYCKNKINGKNRFELQKIIAEEIAQHTQEVTDKQKVILLQIGYTEQKIREITKMQAIEIIAKGYKKDSTNYIYNFLIRAFKDNLIKKGNRSYFYFYLAIGLKRMGYDEEQALKEANKYNKELNLPNSELKAKIKSGFASITTNITYKTLERDLLIIKEESKKIKQKNKQYLNRKRTTKSNVEKTIIELNLNWENDQKLSIRNLAKKYKKVSKTKVAEIKTSLIKIEVLKVKLQGKRITPMQLVKKYNIKTETARKIVKEVENFLSKRNLKNQLKGILSKVSIKCGKVYINTRNYSVLRI